MTKFKVGDVVIVKENTTAGHPKGTIGRVVKLEERDGTGQKACEVKPIHGAEHSWTMYHYYCDLRKIAKFDKVVTGDDQVEVLNIKLGDVVIIKENRSGGHPAGTLGRVKSVNLDGGRVEVAELSKGWEKTYLHTMKELRKVKGWNK